MSNPHPKKGNLGRITPIIRGRITPITPPSRKTIEDLQTKNANYRIKMEQNRQLELIEQQQVKYLPELQDFEQALNLYATNSRISLEQAMSKCGITWSRYIAYRAANPDIIPLVEAAKVRQAELLDSRIGEVLEGMIDNKETVTENEVNIVDKYCKHTFQRMRNKDKSLRENSTTNIQVNNVTQPITGIVVK